MASSPSESRWERADAILEAALELPARERSLRLDVLPALLTAWASVGVIGLTGPDWMPAYRLMMPYVPLWGALFVCGTAALADYVPRRAAAGPFPLVRRTSVASGGSNFSVEFSCFM
mgnify:CR=1 FL=1